MSGFSSAITKTCGDAYWGDMEGGGVAEPLGYSLVVLHKEAVHKQIQDLHRKVLAEFTRQPTSLRALTNCFSGQLVYLVSGTRQNIVTGVIPVVGSVDKPDGNDAPFASRHMPEGPFMFVSQREESGSQWPAAGGTVGYQPMVEKSIFGAWLEIRPTLIPDGNAAIVDLRSTITALGKPMAILAAQPPQATGAPQVDRVAVDTLELASTLSVPLGQPVLIGGLTRVASSTLETTSVGGPTAPAPEKPKETPQLYLILELRADAVN